MQFQGTKLSALVGVTEKKNGEFVAEIALISLDENGALLGSRTHHLVISPEMGFDDRIAQFNTQSERGQQFEIPERFERVAGLNAVAVKFPPLSDQDVIALTFYRDKLWTPELLATIKERQDREAAETAAKEVERVQAENAVKEAQEAAFLAMADKLGFQRKPN